MNEKIVRADILKELFNIGVGKSAAMLSEIIDKKILLNVPDLKIIGIEEDAEALYDYINNAFEGALMVSSISFEEELAGKASLIFPADKMRRFINLCLHEENTNTSCGIKFTDIDFDIIKEVGNIILNAIIGEIGNYVNMKFSYTLPEINILSNKHIDKMIINEEYAYVLILYITFNIEDSELEGAIIINLALSTLDQIFKKICMKEDDLNG
ncbi:chemotaxis protein CheC [Cellulosilyticum sp. I15G10I2]|uniref:chemotaxis protein CheC n=1 Tax=Cellulosilyticum sp. I15G10I2 TaxID=1892843 RepID=UPI00085BDC9C|nr:chemotaxis protein CheC [Cellulosilyticum sp. I15G10I2]